MMRTILSAIVIGLCLGSPVVHAATIDWAPVDRALGRGGTNQADDVHKYSVPRTDLRVNLDGAILKPALALSGWIAFKPMDHATKVMGDLVLTGDELNAVMDKLLAGGIEVTAMHNHLLSTEPETFYMHIHGEGDPVQLATTIHDALAASKTPLTAASAVATLPDLDIAPVEQVLGFHATANGGVWQFSIPRADRASDGGMPLPLAMGMTLPINFQPTGGGKAAITGDFVLLAGEITPVLTALRRNGIEVTALHNHMLGDQPRMFFVHFWANDDAVKLAHGLRAALDRINLGKG